MERENENRWIRPAILMLVIFGPAVGYISNLLNSMRPETDAKPNEQIPHEPQPSKKTEREDELEQPIIHLPETDKIIKEASSRRPVNQREPVATTSSPYKGSYKEVEPAVKRKLSELFGIKFNYEDVGQLTFSYEVNDNNYNTAPDDADKICKIINSNVKDNKIRARNLVVPSVVMIEIEDYTERTDFTDFIESMVELAPRIKPLASKLKQPSYIER